MRVAVANLKGGTAKTVTSYFLATALSRRGRTLLVDCDPQGSALSWAGSAEDGGRVPFEVVGLPVKDVHRRVKGLAGDFEHVVLDTPPGVMPQEVSITRAALLAAETAIVAVPPTEIDLDRVMATLELVAEVEPLNDLTFRVLLTRVQGTARDGRDARAEMEGMKLPVMRAEIPARVGYSRAFGEPVEDLGAYELVASELLGELASEEVTS
ncbi:MAG: ParA family protein [Actinomycetota bacterium]|nr:ParA family protein [Actinomycetota bacterium]